MGRCSATARAEDCTVENLLEVLDVDTSDIVNNVEIISSHCSG